MTEPPLDDVAAAVIDLVKRRRAAATRFTSMPVPGLIGRFGDDRTDPAAAQKIPISAGGVRLVAADPIGSGPRPATSDPGNAQMAEEVRECGAVTRLAG